MWKARVTRGRSENKTINGNVDKCIQCYIVMLTVINIASNRRMTRCEYER